MVADLEACRATLGDTHPDTLTSMCDFAGLLQNTGDLDQAEPLFRAALEGRRTKLGDAHPDTQKSKAGVRAFLEAQGKHAEAAAL